MIENKNTLKGIFRTEKRQLQKGKERRERERERKIGRRNMVVGRRKEHKVSVSSVQWKIPVAFVGERRVCCG